MVVSTLGAGSPQPQTLPSPLTTLLDPISRELTRVEEVLAEQVAGFDPRVSHYVDYVLSGTGKRLRPTLALLSGGATEKITDGHIKLGVIVELIHIATLVHDDILDGADIRHRLPTANTRWGNEISVLLGDCLFAHALSLAASFPTTEVCRRVSEATNTVCAGEILQTQYRFNLDLRLDDYLNVIDMKTGALFAVSCELGGSLNSSTPATVESLRMFGSNLGIAYQIYDDCVDILGQERKAGKSLGTDVKKGKLTLPFLLLLQGTAPAKRTALGEMIFRDEPEDRQQLKALITNNGAMNKSLLMIDSYVARAEANLAAIPVNTYSKTLFGLLHYLSAQSRQLLRAA